MTEPQAPDPIQAEVLARMDRADRRVRLAFVAGAALELAFLVAFLLLADFRQRTHLLILLAAVGGYSIVCAGLLALAAHLNRLALRLTRALELLDTRLREGTGRG